MMTLSSVKALTTPHFQGLSLKIDDGGSYNPNTNEVWYQLKMGNSKVDWARPDEIVISETFVSPDYLNANVTLSHPAIEQLTQKLDAGKTEEVARELPKVLKAIFSLFSQTSVGNTGIDYPTIRRSTVQETYQSAQRVMSNPEATALLERHALNLGLIFKHAELSGSGFKKDPNGISGNLSMDKKVAPTVSDI